MKKKIKKKQNSKLVELRKQLFDALKHLQDAYDIIEDIDNDIFNMQVELDFGVCDKK